MKSLSTILWLILMNQLVKWMDQPSIRNCFDYDLQSSLEIGKALQVLPYPERIGIQRLSKRIILSCWRIIPNV